jgi:hypothetical protein
MSAGADGFLISDFEFLISGLHAAAPAGLRNQKSGIRNQESGIVSGCQEVRT